MVYKVGWRGGWGVMASPGKVKQVIQYVPNVPSITDCIRVCIPSEGELKVNIPSQAQ